MPFGQRLSRKISWSTSPECRDFLFQQNCHRRQTTVLRFCDTPNTGSTRPWMPCWMVWSYGGDASIFRFLDSSACGVGASICNSQLSDLKPCYDIDTNTGMSRSAPASGHLPDQPCNRYICLVIADTRPIPFFAFQLRKDGPPNEFTLACFLPALQQFQNHAEIWWRTLLLMQVSSSLNPANCVIIPRKYCQIVSHCRRVLLLLQKCSKRR